MDTTKRQIFYLELEWLGAGEVIFGVFFGRELHFAHRFIHANRDSNRPYTNTATLPVRYELISTGGGASMTQICTTVISDGGHQPMGEVFSKGMVELRVGGTMEEGAIAIRLKSANRRTTIKLLNLGITTSLVSPSGGTYRIYRLFDSDTAVSGMWVSLPNSAVEYQVATAASAVSYTLPSTYVILVEDYVTALTKSNLSELSNVNTSIITSNIEGISDIILVTMAPIYDATIGDYAISLQWQEIN